MGREIRSTANVSSIPRKIDITCQLGDVVSRHQDLITSRDIVLWTDMDVAKHEWGQPWYRIIVMCGSEVASFVLVRNVVADCSPTNPRLTEGV